MASEPLQARWVVNFYIWRRDHQYVDVFIDRKTSKQKNR